MNPKKPARRNEDVGAAQSRSSLCSLGVSVPERPFMLALLGIGVLALVVQLLVTNWGIGLSPDSAQYVAGARSLANGTGFSFPNGDGTPMPITLWPPMFSIILAGPALLGVDAVASARILNGLLFMATVVVSGLLVARLTGRIGYSALAAGLLVLVAPEILLIHAYAWSEPTFLFCGLVSLLLVDQYVSSGGRVTFALAALSAAMAMMARYPGLAFILAGATVLLLSGSGTLIARLRKIVLFIGISLGPAALWLVHTFGESGRAAGRGFELGAVTSPELYGLRHELSLWLVPDAFPGSAKYAIFLIMGAALAVLLIYGLLTRWRPMPLPSLPLYASLTTFGITYSTVVIASRLVILPRFPLDDMRYWIPVYVGLVLLGTAAAQDVVKHWTSRSLAGYPARPGAKSALFRLLPSLLLVYFATPQAFRSATWGIDAYLTGLGFNSVSWHEAKLVAFVRQLPQGTVLYSNGEDVINVLTERPAFASPVAPDGTTGRDQADYEADLSTMERTLSRSHGYFIYFNGITWRRRATDEEIEKALPLEIVFRAEEGTAYVINTGP